jgi:hypothetical protein
MRWLIKEDKLEEMINKICGQLPEGWEINLCMENGAAWVELISQNGNGGEDMHIDGGDKTLEEQLNEALCVANGFSA